MCSTLKRLDRHEGTTYVEFMITLMITMVVVFSVIQFFNVFYRYQDAVYLAKRMARAIEVSGIYNTQTQQQFRQLADQVGLNGATLSIEDTAFFDSLGHIQLRQMFTVRVRVTYVFHVVRSSRLPALSFDIPFDIRISGMSEVYHKP